MKYSTQLRRMVGAFFFICCHSNAYRKLLKKLLSVVRTMDTTLFLALLNTDTNCGPFSVVLTGFDRNKSLLLNWIGPVSCFAAFSKLVLGLIHFQPPLLIIHAEGKCSKSTTGSLKINPAAYFLLFRISSRCGGWANHNSGSLNLKS